VAVIPLASGPGVDRRLAAILNADVAGYSHLMADDEPATVRTLAVYREVLADLVRRHHGRSSSRNPADLARDLADLRALGFK
jgi:class 3 adenylate cyclase